MTKEYRMTSEEREVRNQKSEFRSPSPWPSPLSTGARGVALWLVVTVAVVLAARALGKNQKDAGTEDPPIKFPLPVVDAKSPQEELNTFKVEEGFEVQLVASEPMVEDPIALSFDGQGRMWVVELRGYMHDIEGAGEDQPVGRIKLLTDTDGDGKFDKATIFLDKLLMPRGVMVGWWGGVGLGSVECRGGGGGVGGGWGGA